MFQILEDHDVPWEGGRDFVVLTCKFRYSSAIQVHVLETNNLNICRLAKPKGYVKFHLKNVAGANADKKGGKSRVF